MASSQEWTCHMSECQEPYHALRECGVFQGLTTWERTRRVRRLRLCDGCLTLGHSTGARRYPYRKEDEGLCPVKKCGRGHHSLLHINEPEEVIGSADSPEAGEEEWALCNSKLATRNPVQLMTQWVRDGGGGSCLAFWDLGSQVSLMTT